MKKRSLAAGVLVLLLAAMFAWIGCSNPTETIYRDPNPNLSKNVVDIYSFNDFHGTVDKSASTSNPGADRFAAVVKGFISMNPQSIVLSAGDSYQGSPLSNVFYGEPVSEMIKYLGVKYSAIGNHEFDWGSDKISKFAKDGGITFLAANIFLKGTDNRPDWCKPYGIVTVGTKKIGIIGLTTTEVPTLVKAEYVADLDFRAPGEWLSDIITDLKDNQGCNAVIALAHMGAGPSANTNTSEPPLASSELGELANTCPEFDGIFGGHQHTLISGSVNTIPIVVGNYNGRGLSRLTLTFDDNDVLLTVEPKNYGQNNMNNSDFLPAGLVNTFIKDVIAKYNDKVGPMFSEVVGKYDMDINSREDQAEWANKVVYDYIVRETGDDNYILFQNWGGWRDTSPYARLATDEVTLGYLYTLMPFDNEIVLLEMKGDKVINLLEFGSYPNTQDPVVTGVFFDGTDWILEVTGEAIVAGNDYKVACNDFMLTGGDSYPFPSAYIGDAVFMGVPLRNAMIEELKFRAGL